MPILPKCMLFSKNRNEQVPEHGWNVSKRVPVPLPRSSTGLYSVSSFTLVNSGLEVSPFARHAQTSLTCSQLLHVLRCSTFRAGRYRGPSPNSTHPRCRQCRHDILRSLRRGEIRSSMATIHRRSMASNLVDHLCRSRRCSSPTRERSCRYHVDCRYLSLYRFFRRNLGSNGLGRHWRNLPSEDQGQAGLARYRWKLAWKL